MAKKNRKVHRDAKLAIAPNPNYQKQAVKSAMSDSNDIGVVCHTPGRKGFMEKLKTRGLFYRCVADVKRYKQSNQDASFLQLYIYLQEKYPDIFDTPVNKKTTGSNFKKVIDAEPLMSSAWYGDYNSLIDLAEIRLYEVLTKDDIEPSISIRAYDTLKKYEEVKIDEEDDSNKIVFGFSD